MIIFGTRGIKSTVKTGQFTCPQCAAQRPYVHKKVKKFFTLYFIPLIPLGDAGDYVECQSCRGTFVSRVLDYRPNQGMNQFQSQYEKAMRHCMVKIMLADGVIDDNEMLMVQKIINKFGHNDMTLDELRAFVTQVERNPQDISVYLKAITPSLNEHGKEIIIKCAIAVAASDGHIDKSEIEQIQRMSQIMEMSPSHVRGILGEMTSKSGQTA